MAAGVAPVAAGHKVGHLVVVSDQVVQREPVALGVNREDASTPDAIEVVSIVDGHPLMEADPSHSLIVGHRRPYTG